MNEESLKGQIPEEERASDGSTVASNQEALESQGWQGSYTLVIVLNLLYVLFFLWLTMKYSHPL